MNGDVKSGKYEKHSEFFLLIGEVLLCEQLMEFLGMPGPDSKPTKHIPGDFATLPCNEQKDILERALNLFLHTYRYGYVSDNNLPSGDNLFNYCNQVAHFALHLMNLNDTAKEGDIDRVFPNMKYNARLFYSHNTSSKYYHEVLDFLLKTMHTLSPQMKIRVLDGLFVNEKGGHGMSKETDLAMELSIKTKKGLAHLLKSNKSQEALQKSQLAAEVIGEIVRQFDKFAKVVVKSGSHTKASTAEDFKKAQRIYRNLRPFAYNPGRNLSDFLTLAGTPCGKMDPNVFMLNSQRVLGQLFAGQEVETDEPDEEHVIVIDLDSDSDGDSDGEV